MSDTYSRRSIGYGFLGIPMGTRTPISFGTILNRTMRKIIPGMKKIKEGSSEEYLYYLYRKGLGKGWYGFALFQAARRKGAFTVEVAFGRRKVYPSYWVGAKPDYSIDAVRERAKVLTSNKDEWWTYSNVAELENALESAIRGSVGEGISTLYDNQADRLSENVEKWKKRIDELREKMKGREESKPVEIFPDLPNVEDTYEYIKDQLRLRTFEKLYPPYIRNQMGEREFIILQSCLMSDIIELPETPENALIEERSVDYVDDIIPLVSSVMPRESYIIPTEDEREAYLRYSYFLSLSILESILGIEKEQEEAAADES